MSVRLRDVEPVNPSRREDHLVLVYTPNSRAITKCTISTAVTDPISRVSLLPPDLTPPRPTPPSGFQHHVRQPYVMFTTLRNPLELFVSGQQYLNRKATRRFANVRARFSIVPLVSWEKGVCKSQ